ncbi:hypothetical protein HZS_1206 [Henneguya salminicola]|nr:hypothetical protein HZS_1206 [Henneguya salminicola]
MILHEHDIIFYSIETHKIIDLWRYPLFKSQTIKLDNIYGINGIIRITVSSIYWKNYYDFNNKCCDETEEDICKNSCDYSFELIPNQNVQITRKAPLDKYDKQNSIFFSKNTVFDLTIKIQKTDEEKTLLDEIQIVKIENEPNIQYSPMCK